MTGQIAASGSLPLELVAVLVVVAMLLGAVDIIRQPGWAWKQAEESQLAYLILDLLLPVIGLGLYAFRARPKLTALVAAGPATDPATTAAGGTEDREADRPEPAIASVAAAGTSPTAPARSPGPAAGPAAGPATDPGSNRFTSFREMTDSGPASDSDFGSGSGEPAPDADQPEVFEISSTFFSTGAATRTVRHPLALARAYRPRQRTSLSESESEVGSESESRSDAGSHSESESESRPEVEAEGRPEAEVAPRAMAQPNVEARSTAAAAAELELVRQPQAVADVLTVPSGWKVDPTGRHQFRYWDGYHWTENVADDGAESRDAVSA